MCVWESKSALCAEKQLCLRTAYCRNSDNRNVHKHPQSVKTGGVFILSTHAAPYKKNRIATDTILFFSLRETALSGDALRPKQSASCGLWHGELQERDDRWQSPFWYGNRVCFFSCERRAEMFFSSFYLFIIFAIRSSRCKCKTNFLIMQIIDCNYAIRCTYSSSAGRMLVYTEVTSSSSSRRSTSFSIEALPSSSRSL